MAANVDLLETLAARMGCFENVQYRNLVKKASAYNQPRPGWCYIDPETENPWYHTALCNRSGNDGQPCTWPGCVFAHAESELRPKPIFVSLATDPAFRFEVVLRKPASASARRRVDVLRASGPAECADLVAAKDAAAAALLREALRGGLDAIGDAWPATTSFFAPAPPMSTAEVREVVQWLCAAAKTDGALALALLEADSLAWARELWALLAEERPVWLARILTTRPASFSAFERAQCGPVRAVAKQTALHLGLAPTARAPTPPAPPSTIAWTGAPTVAPPRPPPRLPPGLPSEPAPPHADRALEYVTRPHTDLALRASSPVTWKEYTRAAGEAVHPLVLAELAEPSPARGADDEWVSVTHITMALSRALRPRRANALFVAIYLAKFDERVRAAAALVARAPCGRARRVRGPVHSDICVRLGRAWA
jgi:hypothetical protein